LNQVHLALFDLFTPILLGFLLLDLDLDLLPEHLRQLYALILIIRGLQRLLDLSVLVPLEYLLHFLARHPRVLMNQHRSRLSLQVSHLLVDLVKLSTDQLLLVVDALADEEDFLLQGCRLVLGELARGLGSENVFG
jgi:hypothetical protein